MCVREREIKREIAGAVRTASRTLAGGGGKEENQGEREGREKEREDGGRGRGREIERGAGAIYMATLKHSEGGGGEWRAPATGESCVG